MGEGRLQRPRFGNLVVLMLCLFRWLCDQERVVEDAQKAFSRATVAMMRMSQPQQPVGVYWASSQPLGNGARI